jgi:LEA14-like dessication related protein
MANGSRGDRSPDGTGTDGKVDGDDGSRLSALVATTPRAVATLVVALVLLVVVAYFLGIVGVPSAGLVDRGDWGTVTEERTEVITTVWVDNTNPFPIALGDGLSADYEVAFNGVALASGEKDAIEVPKGNSTIELRTNLRNDRLPAWWVAFVRANETVAMDINGTLSVDVGPTVSHDIYREQTALEDSTPIISALSAAANGTRGTYTQSVGSDQVSDDVDLNALSDEGVTVGYEVREGSARWGEVTEEQTTVVFEFTVHNPGDVPVPAVPDGLGVTVDMNDVRLFRGESGDLSASSVSPDAVIPPGETQTVEFTVRMDNEKVDEWFTSHVRRDERTAVSTGLQLVFEVPPTGQTVRLPRNSPVTYDCQLQTAILVDDQTTETNCGEPGSAAGGGSDDGDGTTSGTATRTTVATRTTLVADGTTLVADGTTLVADGTTLVAPGTTVAPTGTVAPTPTPEPAGTPTDTPRPPDAAVSANTTSGSAPLTVAFDGSASSDPDGNITSYTWTFDDLSPPAEGERVVHTFEAPGTYEVTLTVVDGAGQQDTAAVTVEVSAA